MSLSVVKMGNSFFIFFGIKTTLAKVIKKGQKVKLEIRKIAKKVKM